MDIPSRFNCCIDGTYYKIGKFNYVFMWNNDHWQRSAKEVSDLTKKSGETSSQNKGNSKGNPTKSGPTKRDVVLDLIKTYGALSKAELMQMSGMKRGTLENAAKDLTGAGKLCYNKVRRLYVLPVDPQIGPFPGAAS